MDAKKRNRNILTAVTAIIVLIIVFYIFRNMINAKETEQNPEISGQGITAMYVPVGENSYVFVDTENDTPFTVHFPDELYDIKGKKISEDDLKSGNIVKIYGDGIMLESYPGQYPGVTEIRVTKEGSPDDADQYQNIVDSIYQEPDPSEPPSLNLEFEIPMASVSAITNRGAYNWRYQDKSGNIQEAIADTAHVLMWKEIVELNLERGTDLKLRFSAEPESVSALRWKEEVRETAAEGSEVPEGEEISVQETDDQWYLPQAEPGYVYLIRAEWKDGIVEYGFLS
ncbi:MAG: hypothetical protein Q4D16_09100 [Eubacteriales bacterium]|nr:hypothetical protein [Eubacteriales bacterium]